MGPNPLTWLWPKKMQGDGLSFPVTAETDPRLPYYWPPRDPDDLRPSIFSSKYKRQQEARRLLQENPDAMIDDDESEGYYDSGSFVTDSENEYSIDDEEEGMRQLVNNRLYDLSGSYYSQGQHTTKRHFSQPSDTTDEDEEEDTIPLSTFVTKKKIPSSKED
jgi:hypothetical protein